MQNNKNDPAGKSPEEIRENMERKTAQMQILQMNMRVIHERQHALAMRLQELEETKQAIGDLKSVKSGSEILAPIGSGNFVSGKISSTEKILVGIGGGIAIKKSPEDALKFLEGRVAEAGAALQGLKEQSDRIEEEFHRLQSA